MTGIRARVIVAVLLVLASWLPSARADEPRTFYGKTVHEWIAVLRDKASTDQKRRQAMWALGHFGAEAKEAVPDVVAALGRKELANAAVGALIGIGESYEVTIPRLIEKFLKRGCQHLTGQGAFGYDRSIEDSLVRIGQPAVPDLMRILNGPSWELRVCAAHVLSRIGPAAVTAVPLLIRTIEQPDPQHESEVLTLYAVRALGGIGPAAKAAVPVLNKLLDKKDGNDFDVAMALDRIGVPPVQKLLDVVLRDGDPYVAQQLAWLGPNAHDAVPALRAALTDKRPQFRFSAAGALAFIDPSAADAIPVLIEALNYLSDENIEVSEVPLALAHFGPRARKALPALISLVNKGCDDTDLLRALVQIDPEGHECVPALIAALKQDDGEVADVAAKCLGLLGPRAKQAVPALVVALTRDFDELFDNSTNPQVSAAHAVRRIGAPAMSAIPDLAVALKHCRKVPEPSGGEALEERDFSAAAAAAEVLGSFGAKAKSAVLYLVEAVKTKEKDNDNWFVRQAAILALGRIGLDAKAAVPVIRNVMKSDGKHPRFIPESLIALYQLDPAGKELAESWLQEQIDHPNEIGPPRRMEARTRLLGAMGRTSLEADWTTRRLLEKVDSMFGSMDPREAGGIEYLEEWLDTLGGFGAAGRVAIPRLKEFAKHPNPWVRMWAAEALERITAPAHPAKAGQ